MEIDAKEIIDRQYSVIKFLIISCIVAFVALVVSNIAWVWLWNQYDYVTTETTEYTIEQDGEGVNVIDGSFNGAVGKEQ